MYRLKKSTFKLVESPPNTYTRNGKSMQPQQLHASFGLAAFSSRLTLPVCPAPFARLPLAFDRPVPRVAAKMCSMGIFLAAKH